MNVCGEICAASALLAAGHEHGEVMRTLAGRTPVKGQPMTPPWGGLRPVELGNGSGRSAAHAPERAPSKDDGAEHHVVSRARTYTPSELPPTATHEQQRMRRARPVLISALEDKKRRLHQPDRWVARSRPGLDWMVSAEDGRERNAIRTLRRPESAPEISASHRADESFQYPSSRPAAIDAGRGDEKRYASPSRIGASPRSSLCRGERVSGRASSNPTRHHNVNWLSERPVG